ncbi:transglutaminase-like superfamily protein [Burkholderia thailandensis E264]|uniref:Lipoprotein, putative n=1 Tax=Burkholderia thailandensis (strain ATCC 700388 / DSM 13276 / CCUG 48851 / CIP 106301 / E264) TaxID=271848 RepID=Q2T8P9_BURTA|nr:DUF3857 domain-containing protein [Burkholderia thailandensis]ABC35163.1 lipoprotein, putative [Burkholderia thailandensis E264]AHI75460.1 transglutaminase-like superfamily protein [Burkholderia thailandensis 2002721723]AIP28726.1 transglutaminase-like superfamily protein [Burkholderia thailandensis E264]AJY01555.1 hypothetical protein BG87_5374 [Burkholderia thailandensis 2002721643]NBC90750.1 DUF3857 domain-containing protein [Burkholderia thailandensis]
MYVLIRLSCAACSSLFIGCASASPIVPDSAAAAADAAPATVVSDVHVFVVQRDGALDEHDDSTLRANTASGIDDAAQRYVWFNKDIDRVELLRAETIDRAGVAHPVGPEAVRDVQEQRSAGAPFFEDGVLRSVIFPGVDVGARTRLVFRKSRTKPRDPGYFSYFAVPSRMPVDAQRLIFDLPADMPLYADARGYVARAPVTENGRTRYEFDYRHGPYPRIERGSVGYATYGDRLMVSTLRDFAAFAGRYRAAAVDASAADPAVARLAESIAANANASGARAKARAIYDWVRMNVRYVALFLGETAAAPHKVTDILRNRYGDCKDHVALFGALLAALGIRSEPVLLNLGSVYTLPDVPGYGGGAISHAITWLPDLGLFADTTVGGVEFGYLPPVVMDRPALLVDEGVLSRTPAAQPRARGTRLRIDVAPSGAARYQYYVEDGGWTAELERSLFRQAARERVQQLAADRLRQSGLLGTAQVGTSERDVTGGPFSTSMTGTLEHFAWPDGTTALPALSSLAGGIATQVQGWLAEPVRTQPWLCIGGEFDERAQIALPDTMRVTDLPADAAVHDRFFDYESHYVFDAAARVVQITRSLRARFAHQACSPEEFDAARASLERIERDALAQIVVRAKAREEAPIDSQLVAALRGPSDSAPANPDQRRQRPR